MTSDTASIDGTTIDSPTGKLVLLIEESRAWEQLDLMHQELTAKVRGYVRYVRSEDFTDWHGRKPADTMVRLVTAENPPEVTFKLFERIRYELGKHGIVFQHSLDNAVTPPKAEPRRPAPTGSVNGGPRTKTPQTTPQLRPPQPSASEHASDGNGARRPRATSTPRAASAAPAPPAEAVVPPTSTTPAAPVQVQGVQPAVVRETASPVPVTRPAKRQRPPVAGAPTPEVSRSSRTVRNVLILVWLGTAAATTLWGLEYYLTPLHDRAYSELHDLFKPNGTIGLWYGIIGTVMVTVGTLMYSLRKRVRMLFGAGRLAGWLQIHVFLCTLGPYLVLLHTSFKFGGVVSVAFWSMVTVVLSGFFGRYLFAHIPKHIGGRMALLEVVQTQQKSILEELARTARLKADAADRVLALGRQRKPKGLLDALVLTIRSDLTKQSLLHQIESRLAMSGTPRPEQQRIAALVLKEIELEQQIGLLMPLQRLFGYWHVVHLPLSTTMFVIVLMHIVVAVVFGWVF